MFTSERWDRATDNPESALINSIFSRTTLGQLPTNRFRQPDFHAAVVRAAEVADGAARSMPLDAAGWPGVICPLAISTSRWCSCGSLVIVLLMALMLNVATVQSALSRNKEIRPSPRSWFIREDFGMGFICIVFVRATLEPVRAAV